MYNTKSSTLNISLNRNKQKQQDQANMYKQQQTEIEKQQQLFHMMGQPMPGPTNTTPTPGSAPPTALAFNGHQSATHFLASLLQNPTVLQNPELMASVAGMLQSSLSTQQAVPMAPIGASNAMQAGPTSAELVLMPQTGNCFRNFSIPNSDASSQLQSIINSSCNGGASNSCSHSIHSGDRSSQRSPSSTSSASQDQKERFSAASHISSDNESLNNSVDIGKFANSSELVINKVMTVIEEILHNDNIRKNNFLAKLFEDRPEQNQVGLQMRPEILVKRVAGFKRVKAITTEFKVVQAAMGMSKMFDLGADGLSAFRTMPLPNLMMASGHLGGPHSILHGSKNVSIDQAGNVVLKDQTGVPKEQRIVKKILAINFAPCDFTIEKMTTIFEKIGEIAQIVLIRPSKKIPEFLSEYAQWVPDLGSKPCAVIDFENQEAAQNACREINLSNRVGNGIRCALLKPGARIKRTLYRKYNAANDGGENNVTFSPNANSLHQSQRSGHSHMSRDSAATTNNNTNNIRNTTKSTTPSFNSREHSLDSGINQNNDYEPIKKGPQDHFNRKNVKKAISKHFISLGAWKNSSDQGFVNESGNGNISNFSGFVRQPKGPVGQGFGLRRSI